MDDTFDLPVFYKNKQLYLKAKLVQSGYTSKIEVDVNGHSILFEPDEERNYRAIADPVKFAALKEQDIELIKAIGETLEEVRKQK